MILINKISSVKINKTGINILLNNKNIDIKCPFSSLAYLNSEIQNLTNNSKINRTIIGKVIESNLNNPLNSTFCLFYNCSNIKEIIFSNSDAFKHNNISHIFKNGYSSISDDLSNLNIINVNLIRNIFYKFLNLIFNNLSNFDTFKVTNMDKLFYNCTYLKNLKLLNFTDKEISLTKDMFYRIIKNTAINIGQNKALSKYYLSNNMTHLTTLRKLNENLTYNTENNDDNNQNLFDPNYPQNENQETENNINNNDLPNKAQDDSSFYSDEESNSIWSTEKNYECYETCKECTNDEGNSTNHNCISCSYNYSYYFNIGGSINCYNSCSFYFYFNSNDNNTYCTGDLSCPDDFNKLIPNKSQCTDNCTKDSNYSYEFNHTCYQECPNNTNAINDFICKLVCTKDYPYEIVRTQICVENCTILQRESGMCIINYKLEDENNQEVEDKEVENIKEELTSGFNTSNIDEGKNIIIKQKDSTVTISTTKNQKNSNLTNITTINLGECETKIKKEYNISENESLYILKIDVNQKGLKIPKIAYEVYYPLYGDKLIKLNLTACQNSKIEILIPVNISEDLFLVNPDSEYYNDICYTYTSEDGTDILLSDRINNFVQDSLTVCEEGCHLNGYKNGFANCSCDVKINSTTKISDIVFDRSKLFDSFENFKNIINLDVLKCYKLIFNLNAFKHNYGNLIMLTIIIFFLITLFIFYFKDYKYLKKILDMIVFFKLKSNLVKYFLERKKREEQIRLNNLKKLIENKKNKKGIIEDLNLPRPLILEYLYLRKKYEVKDAKTKKFEQFCKSQNIKIKHIIKNKKNLNYFNNNLETNNLKTSKRKIIDKNNGTTEEKTNIIKKIDYPYHMDENEAYEIFLLIYKKSDTEMNELSYNSAIKIDKRNYFEFYLSLIRTKHLLIFSFWPAFDYNSQILKIFLFFFNFSLSFFVNALFFNDETMHKIYEDKGSFDFIYNLPQILLSSLISGFINGIIQEFALTDSIFISIKERVHLKNLIIRKQKSLRIIKIKIILFFIIAFLLLALFWFYLACFCAVYKNTQIHLIKDTVISFGTSMIIPFGIYALPGIFRIISLKTKKKNKRLMFKFSKFLLFIFDRIL